MRFRFGVYTLLVLLFTSACTTPGPGPVWNSDDLLIDRSDNLISPETITKRQARADIGLLLFALRTAYGGRDFVPPREIGNAVSQLEETLANVPEIILVSQFCNDIANALSQIRDAHLSAFSVTVKGFVTCGSDRPTATVSHVGKNVATKSGGKAWELIWKKKIAIFAIPSFPVEEDPGWGGFMEAVARAKDEAQAIVFDLRGNSGGSDTMAWRMAEILYGGKPSNLVASIIKSLSPQTLALRINSYQFKIRRLEAKKESTPSWLLEKRADAQKQYRLAISGKLPSSITIPQDIGTGFDQKNGFAHPIFLLTDRECLSACEGMLNAFEGHPFARTAGENTGGALHFGTVGKLFLHGSQVGIGIATDFWRYRDARFVEKVGYSPKIRVPEGHDALEVALKSAVEN